MLAIVQSQGPKFAGLVGFDQPRVGAVWLGGHRSRTIRAQSSFVQQGNSCASGEDPADGFPAGEPCRSSITAHVSFLKRREGNPITDRLSSFGQPNILTRAMLSP